LIPVSGYNKEFAGELFTRGRCCKATVFFSAINISTNNFQKEVMNSDKPVLLDFWAPWCGPCRMVVPIIEEIAEERSDIKVGKINVDEQPELAGKFGIMTIPTLVVMKNGEIVKQVSGARSKNAILEMLPTWGGRK
jgi:thioredoxin 1